MQAVNRSNGQVFHSRCDGQGNFVIRYLPVGEYTVHAHDDDAGWCDLGTFQLDQPVVDCGEHQLAQGGGVAGVLRSKLLPVKDDSVIKAIAPDGVEILVDEVKEDGTFLFGGMRPGPWVVQSPTQAGQIIRRSVEIQRGQTVNLAKEENASTR